MKANPCSRYFSELLIVAGLLTVGSLTFNFTPPSASPAGVVGSSGIQDTRQLHQTALVNSPGADLQQQHSPGSEDEVVDIGNRKQLFIDRYLIESLENVRQVLMKPVKHQGNPVIMPDRPWEHILLLGFGNVIYDSEERVFKMWYWNWTQPWGQLSVTICYATSRDGVHWEKPILNLVSVDGSKANNVVFKAQGKTTIDSGNIVKDLHDPDPSRRYKLLCWWYTHDVKHERPAKSGLLAAFSPDGIHWKEYESNPIVDATSLGLDDTHTLLGWDENVQKYVAYMKPRVKGKPRVVGYSTSNDFVHWTKPTIVITPDERDPQTTQFYKMPVIKYHNLYLGMLYVYHQAGIGLPNTGGNVGDDTIDAQLAVSRNGFQWDRPFREPFIPVGSAGSFDSGMIMASQPVIAGDDILLYYGGFDRPHMALENHASIGLARLRLDGFVAVEAGEKNGMLTTKPFRFKGHNLQVNVDAHEGEMMVEILDEKGTPQKGFRQHDCDRINRDGLRKTVTWKGKSDVGSLLGKVVRLRFHLRHAKLYSFQFTPDLDTAQNQKR